jgi:hypothetical protein
MNVYKYNSIDECPELVVFITKYFTPDHINFLQQKKATHYVGKMNDKIVTYCNVNTTHVFHDFNLKFHKKNKYKNVLYDEKNTLKYFKIINLRCLYDFIRDDNIIYKGIGVSFLKLIPESHLYLATTEEKLYNYYLHNKFVPTDYFDTNDNIILRRILLYKK